MNVSKRVTVYMIINLVNTIISAANPASVTNRFYPYQLFKDADGNNISMPWIYRTDSLTALYQTKSGINLNYNPIDEMNNSSTKGNTFHANITRGIVYTGSVHAAPPGYCPKGQCLRRHRYWR